jgi:hypothetical protein
MLFNRICCAVRCHLCLLSLLLTSCSLDDARRFDASFRRRVTITYVHVANVTEIRAPAGSPTLRSHPYGFWAVFDVCTIDIAGSALAGFAYDADKFFVTEAGVDYGSDLPALVSLGPLPPPAHGVRQSNDKMVRDFLDDVFPGPQVHHFSTQYQPPTRFYPNLGWRIAVFLKERPNGYRTSPLDLKYKGTPEIVADLRNARPDHWIVDRGLYGFPDIPNSCP